jgi:exodeoxyribonuclease VII large subunit
MTSEGDRVARSAERLHPSLEQLLERKRDALARLRVRPAPLKDHLQRQTSDLNRLDDRLGKVMTTRIAVASDRLGALDRIRESLGYQQTLRRGYAVIRDGERVVTTSADARQAVDLEIEFADGRVKPKAT